MSKWWEQDMSMAGQGLFADPSTAVSLATVPDQLLTGQSYKDYLSDVEERERDKRGGFMQQMMSGISAVGGALDGALSNVPGWGVAKNVANAAILQPVDKVASGMYWLYSEAVSQPLSTAFLVGGKANIYGPGQFFKGSAWSSAYHEAEHISPGQALYNVSATTFDVGTELPGVPSTGELTSQQRQQMERFLYDTEFWRDRHGWVYDAGTGTLDFMANIADPIGGVIVGGSRAVKGLRSIKVTEGTVTPSVGKALAQGGLAGAGKAIPVPTKTAAQASQSKKVSDFFDWAEGKSPFEIGKHPMWGSGRRVNPSKDQLSELLAVTARNEMPVVLRFAMGDNAALQELSTTSQNLVTQLGMASDNRKLLAGHTWDSDILDSYVAAARQAAPAPVGVVPLAQQALYEAGAQAAISKRIQSNYGPSVWAGRAKAWQKAQINAADIQIQSLQSRENYFGTVLGDNLNRAIDDISPADSNLFGSLKELYRMGPIAIRDTEKAADRAITGATVARRGREASGGVASRLIQRGYYNVPLRVYQSFGDRLPEGVVNHNEVGSVDRVNDMLKQVPGLQAADRLGMLQQYSSAGDKLMKSAALKAIQSRVVFHMVNSHNLNDDIAQFADDIISGGWEKSMFEMTGRTPASQRFTAAKSASGKYLDVIEDGTGRRIAPYAKTQLSAADPLLDVRLLDRILSRNSGHFSTLTNGGGKVYDNVKTFADAFNGMWKASTLLRGGYALRAPSEEIVAGAVKFGLITSMMDAGTGGVNWVLNRPQFVRAVTGRTGIHIDDPAMLQSAKEAGLPVEHVKVNKAYPMVQRRISDTRKLLADAERDSRRVGARMAKTTDLDKLDDLTIMKQDLLDEIDNHKNVIQEFVDYSYEILRQGEVKGKRRRLGEGSFIHSGVKVPQAFNEEWAGVIPRDQITSANAMSAIYARGEAIDTARIIKSGSWKTIMPGEDNHMSSWLDALNKQFAQDPLILKVLEDSTLKSAKSFLATPIGRQHLRALTIQARDPGKLLQTITHTLDQYIPEGTGLRSKLSRGEKVTEQDLRQAMAQQDFPTIHGEELRAISTGNSATRIVDDAIAKGFKILGTIPSDIMSRQPIYVRAHSARMRELVDREMSYRESVGKDPKAIEVATINKMMGEADRLARKDLSQVVYDPQRTTATEALRFLSPFMSAHIDGLQRWSGLVMERPELLNTASKIYNAPVAANLVTDGQGNLVGTDGYAVTYDDKGQIVERTFVPLNERVLNLKVPGRTRNIKGVGEVPETGIPIKLQALNTIMPGDPWWNPGSGPLVQIAGSQIAKASPSTGDFLQWAKVLPYGPNGVMDAITPKYMRELWTAWQGDDPDNAKFQETVLQDWNRQSAEHANGGPAPSLKRATDNAKTFTFLKALVSFVTPAQTQMTPLTGTPYQFFADQYKGLLEVDPSTASDVFLSRYGSDYFAFTASMNKSIGIASTAPAVETARMYKDIIDAHPDLAGLIVGPYNQGEYSSSANKILRDMTIAGSRASEKMTAYEAVQNNQRSLGWKHFQKMSGMLDASLFRAGFESYQASGAGGFRALKTQVVTYLTDQYPAWEVDYSTTDRNAIPRRIDAMKQLASDPRLLNDPMRTDIKSLGLYLRLRDEYKAQLSTRENKTLTASGNEDLAIGWARTQMTLAQADTKFNDVFNRYLGNDSLQ